MLISQVLGAPHPEKATTLGCRIRVEEWKIRLKNIRELILPIADEKRKAYLSLNRVWLSKWSSVLCYSREPWPPGQHTRKNRYNQSQHSLLNMSDWVGWGKVPDDGAPSKFTMTFTSLAVFARVILHTPTHS